MIPLSPQIRGAFTRYQDKDLLFTSDTREHVMIEGVLAALAALDADAFEQVVHDRDRDGVATSAGSGTASFVHFGRHCA